MEKRPIQKPCADTSTDNRQQRRLREKKEKAKNKHSIVIVDEMTHASLHTLQECVTPASAFERNMRLLLSILLKDKKITCDTCKRLEINDYCHDQPCIETILQWAKEQ